MKLFSVLIEAMSTGISTQAYWVSVKMLYLPKKLLLPYVNLKIRVESVLANEMRSIKGLLLEFKIICICYILQREYDVISDRIFHQDSSHPPLLFFSLEIIKLGPCLSNLYICWFFEAPCEQLMEIQMCSIWWEMLGLAYANIKIGETPFLCLNWVKVHRKIAWE